MWPASHPRAVAGGLALALHLGLVVLLVHALGATPSTPDQTSLPAAYDVPLPPAAPPPPPSSSPSTQAQGAQGAAGRKAATTRIAAPPPRIRLATATAAPMAGAGASGTGTGSGTSGAGSGSGGTGSGAGGRYPVTPPVKIAGDITAARDYPRQGADRRRGASVVIMLTVGVDGRVTGCRVQRASPDAQADAVTCRLAGERFRFRPALDRQGAPIEADYGWQQRWFAP